MLVVLQARQEKRPEETNRLLVKVIAVGRMNPRIVFVDDDNRTNSVDFVEPLRQMLQRKDITRLVRSPL